MTSILAADAPVLTLDHEGMSYRMKSLTELQTDGLPEAVIVPAVQAYLRSLVDAEAERRRGLVTTAGSGQAMEYQEAYAQADAALAAPTKATAALYPMLAATIGIDIDPETKAPATDVLGVARSVKAAYAAWSIYGAAVRGARLAGKAAIDAAVTVEAACAAFDGVSWPATA